ncbi:uncharacterized protein [Littorina saxatilis]|uniref:uncharacterized protein n=1 Tax=Littorina saxatilis TaxID=31220 RepID=UPI0038B5A8B2
MAGTQTSMADAGSVVNINSASKVYLAHNIIENHVHIVTDEQDLVEDGTAASDCGHDLEENSRVTSWTQTNAFICTGHKETVRICDNYARVDMRIRKTDIQAMAEEEYNPDSEKVKEVVLKCLARFDWNGGEIYAQGMRAWKVTMKEGLLSLKEGLLEAIIKGNNRKDLCHVLEKLIKHHIRLLGLDSGSVVFILQHSSEEEAECATQNPQAIREILLGLLPEWVREKQLEWTVMQCQSSPDQEDGCEMSDPIPLICQQSGNVASVDHRHMERMLQKMTDSIKQELRKGQEEIAREHMKVITQLMQSLSDFQSTIQSVSFEKHKSQQQVSESIAKTEPGQSQEKEEKTLSSPVSETDIRVPEEVGDTNGELVPGGDHVGTKRTSRVSDAVGVSKFLTGKESSRDLEHIPKRITGNLKFPHLGQSAVAAHALIENTGYHPSVDPKPGINTQVLDQKTKDAGEKPLEQEFPKIQKSAPNLGDKDYSSGYEGLPPERVDAHISLRTKEECVPETKHETISINVQMPEADVKAEQARRDDSPDRRRHESSETPKAAKKNEESRTIQAEQLLNWVNVKSKASQSSDPEIQRMMDQVKHALEDEERQSPRARALDTVLVLDTSDSVVKDSLDQLKTVVHTFIDGIEENVDTMNLEENLAVVQIAGRAWVRQHLTNDYNRIRDAVEEMTPESKGMPTGGRTPLFQALLVCLGAIEGRGGVVNVAGCHRVRPRLIFFTDGRPTDEATETGLDVQSNVNEVKFALVQLISEFASKKHKTTPAPIFWVPVGPNPDMPFLESLAALSGGKVVKMENVEELCRYYKVQETIGCVYKMVRKHTDVYDTEQQTMTVINALAGNLSEEEKKYIGEEVNKKKKDPENETGDADDFDNVYEDTDHVADGTLLPLGTRVRRGQDWKWNNQDTEGAGTVIQHRKKQDGWLHVMWDNGTHNAYRYGDGDCRDVEKVDEPRILGGSELIEVGVTVVRGEDWKSGEEDGHGKGIVIRRRKDGKVRVRWENGHIGKYKFGADGKMELKVDPDTVMSFPTQPPPRPTAEEEEQGAVGGFDPDEGQKVRVWQWLDQRTSEWRLYDAESQDKLRKEYDKRKDGSCVLKRGGISRRVLFKTDQEKTVDRGGGMLPIRIQMVSEEQYVRMLQEEEER